MRYIIILLLLILINGCSSVEPEQECNPEKICPVCDCSIEVRDEAGKCTSKITEAITLLEEERIHDESCIKKPNAKQQELARDEIMNSVCYIHAPQDLPENTQYVKYSIIKGVRMDTVCNEKGKGEIIIRIYENNKQIKYLKTDVEVVEHLKVTCDRIINFND